jgi:hypothetical protein
VRPRSFAYRSSGTNHSAKSTRFWSIERFWLRPTKPQTASVPSSTAASITRFMNSCFLPRTAASSCSMLSK